MEVSPELRANIAAPIVLGRYEILDKLGTGGMATVYLARNVGEAGFQRLCAIKVLHPHLAEEVGFVEMLLDEARIAARLHHPNVVPIVDLGTHQTILYVAMEYVEGCSPSALLRRYPDDRPARLLVPIMLDVLAGLDAAHSSRDDDGTLLNIVHRDVSPQNVLLGIDGAARLTDFGIARAGSRLTSTRPGQLKGKIMYMSPEQIRGEPIDCRSDVFSAGVMLWTMLTGLKLFVGDNDAATLNNILADVAIPAPSTVGFKPPAALDAVCLRALERDADKRFASAQEMEEALRQAASHHDLIASRREVGEWVVRGFRDELAARRKGIRMARGSGRNVAQSFGEDPFTPSSGSLSSPLASGRAGSIVEPATMPVAPLPEEPSISITTGPSPKWRWAIGGLAVVCAGILVLGLALRSSSDAPAPAPPPSAEPVRALPPSAEPSTTGSTAMLPSEPPAGSKPTVPGPAVAVPIVSPEPPPSTTPTPVAHVPNDKKLRVSRPPKPVIHKPPVSQPVSKPSDLETPPPVTPPPVTPPKPVPKPQPQWDPDSPAAPP